MDEPQCLSPGFCFCICSLLVSLSELWEMVMDREAWRAVIHGVAKGRTWLSNWTELNWTDLTTSNLPWLMDLTFQVPMQYCSLQHQTLLPSPVTSTTGHCFHFSSVSSLFLVLFLYLFPVSYWAPTDLGSSSVIILSFCLFILFMGFSRQEYWSGLPFPSPVGHTWAELSTMICSS